MQMLSVTCDDLQFSIAFKGVEILRHSPSLPLAEVGTGKADYRPNKKHQAYFRPRDLDTRMQPLVTFSIVEQSSTTIVIELEKIFRLDVNVVDDRLEITTSLLDGGVIAWNRFTLRIHATPDEHVYGLGEQYVRLDMRGRKVPLWTQEPGLARDHSLPAIVADMIMGAGGKWHTTYYPQPTFVSSRHYFVHAESYSYAIFDFTARNHHELQFWAIPKKIIIDVQSTTPEVVGSLSSYLGRQRPLPDWAIEGAWLGIGGGLNDREDGVPWKLKKAIDNHVKVSAVWCEDWTGLYQAASYESRLFWNWRYDAERYPDLPGYIKTLHDQGIKFLGYDNCFLMRHGNMYKEAAEKGFLVKRSDGSVYDLKMFSFSAGMLDLTNPDCVAWIKNIITDDMIGIGMDGWMCDFGEYLPVDAALYSGEDPAIVHNQYPVSWAQVNKDAVTDAGRDSGDDAIVFFNRSGNAGTSRCSPLIWAGDQQVTFQKGNGLPSVICAGLSLGFSGIGHHHSDIGGYFNILWIKRTKELFMRWCELATFTPVMRTHCRKDFAAAINWQWYSDEETIAHFARFSNIHARLLPYTRHVLEEYQEVGLPAMRHPVMHYENDPVLHELRYQYLFGRDMLVAPVHAKGRKKWRVYLPSDEWIHLWSGEKLVAGWVTVHAPIGKPPVFYRASSPFANLFEELRGI